MPHVAISGTQATMAGMGTQAASIVVADHTAAMLVKGEHHLEPLFTQKMADENKPE